MGTPKAQKKQLMIFIAILYPKNDFSSKKEKDILLFPENVLKPA